jgi:hypothetical protein
LEILPVRFICREGHNTRGLGKARKSPLRKISGRRGKKTDKNRENKREIDIWQRGKGNLPTLEDAQLYKYSAHL